MLLCYGQTTVSYVKFLHSIATEIKCCITLASKARWHPLKKDTLQKIQTYTYVHFNRLVPATTPFLVEKEPKEGKRWAPHRTLDGPVFKRAEAAKLQPSSFNQLLPIKWQFLAQSHGTLWALISLNHDCYQKHNSHFLALLYAFFQAAIKATGAPLNLFRARIFPWWAVNAAEYPASFPNTKKQTKTNF